MIVAETKGYVTSDGEFFELIEEAYKYELGLSKAAAKESLMDTFEDEPVYVFKIVDQEKDVLEILLHMKEVQKLIINEAIENMDHDAWHNFKQMIEYEA